MPHAGNRRAAVGVVDEISNQTGKISAMGLGTYFFDVPVYRLPEGRYYNEMNSYMDRQMNGDSPERRQQMESVNRDDPDRESMMRLHFHKSYGGDWRYNEIIGYIRLHIVGLQIRGEHYGVSSKRICKTRTKIFEHRTGDLVRPVDVPLGATSGEIFSSVSQCLTDCARKLKGRYVDRTMLDQLAPFVDWRRLFAEVQQSRQEMVPLSKDLCK